MKRSLAALSVAAGLALSACGSSTVDSSEVTSTEASTSTTAETETTTASAETPATTTSSRKPTPAPAGSAADQPAQEVESVPSQASAYSPEEDAYLEALRNEGINVHGVEDQLTGTGFSVCQGSSITRDAVAGQLIEQRRTELDVNAVAKLIDDTAHEHLC
ncbi:hypothetical protein [Corynebacterium qintianiae]|uniref:hypothetical protein n=1 Tax=Corynebacterium qintianiae TaxID=2709392 RepID=UPI0013EE1E2D|nr:hypothetical protein [Corynebacterium qintianiae]